MKMPLVFPSCFGKYTDLRMKQNLITCLYQTKLAGACRFVTITWCKSVVSQGLSVHVNDPECHQMCKVEMKPWFFCKKQGSKSFNVKGKKVDVFWDLTNAKYVCGPEPHEGFYLALVCDGQYVLLLGDMHREADEKTHARSSFMEPTFLSRREHVFGKRYYTTKAQFEEHGRTHDIVIECHTGGRSKEPRLYVRVDKQVVLQVKHLIWKFRGNQTIQIDGIPIEVFWDVHNWLFNPSIGHAVFMFQSTTKDNVPCPPAVLQWPNPLSLKGPEKRFSKNSLSSSCASSVMQWVLSSSCKDVDVGSPSRLSLLLYAWKSE